MIKINKIFVGIIFSSVFHLASCGGGDSENEVVPAFENQAPIVDAGLDQSVEKGSLVTISSVATDLDGQGVTYQWKQVSGILVKVSVLDEASVSFVAPDVSIPETITFDVTVIDSGGLTASDQVNIHVGIPVEVTGVLRMPKITYVISATRGEAVVNWQPTLNSENMGLLQGVSYSIHASQTENFQPSYQTLKKTNVVELSTTVSDLDVNQTYYFRVVAENGIDQTISSEQRVIVSNSKVRLIDGVKAVKESEIKSSLKNIENGKLALDESDDLSVGDIIVDQETGTAIRIYSVDSENVAVTEPANIGTIFDGIDGDWSAGVRFKVDLK